MPRAPTPSVMMSVRPPQREGYLREIWEGEEAGRRAVLSGFAAWDTKPLGGDIIDVYHLLNLPYAMFDELGAIRFDPRDGILC